MTDKTVLTLPVTDSDRGCQATPRAELERQIMDSNVPKNEREWWAASEIKRLRQEAAKRPAAEAVSEIESELRKWLYPVESYYVGGQLRKEVGGIPEAARAIAALAVHTTEAVSVEEVERQRDELRATLQWVSLALPVLRTMCDVADLIGGKAKAEEMIEGVNATLASIGVPLPPSASRSLGPQTRGRVFDNHPAIAALTAPTKPEASDG